MIRHIVALDSQRGIAKDGSIPWNLPTDKQYYRKQIQKHGGIVLMGRKTFEGAGEELRSHDCYVLTHDEGYQPDGATVIHFVDELMKSRGDVWVVGGAGVYEATLPWAEELYVTEIESDFDCDTFYPEYINKFELRSTSEPVTESAVTFRFRLYTPRNT